MSMAASVAPPKRLPAWQALEAHRQWAVELGKVLAARIIHELQPGADHELTHDSSTNALIRRYGPSKEPPHGQ